MNMYLLEDSSEFQAVQDQLGERMLELVELKAEVAKIRCIGL